MKISLWIAAAVLNLSYGLSAYAQDGLVVSSRESQLIYSNDVSRLVEATFPTYDDATLKSRLAQAAKTLGERTDRITTRSIAGIEQVMGFDRSGSTANEVDTTKAYYRVDGAKGKSFATFKNDSFTDTAATEFLGIEANVKTAQTRFLSKLGLPSDEMMKTSYGRILVRDAASSTEAARVRGATTAIYRGYAGFPIETSFAKIHSFNAQRIERFSLSWPAFKLHRDVQDMSLASKANIKSAISERLKAALPAGQKAKLVMGVVFRGAYSTDGQLVHFPAMKVVLSPESTRTSEGQVLSDAGLEFYANILARAPVIAADDIADGNSIRE